MYIAHPTHGAGTRPNRTQPPTAPRKTTLNADQCVRQPGEGRGRNRQATPPQKKKQQRGEGGGALKQPTATKPPANTTRGGQTPRPRKHQREDPQRGTAKTGNTKPGTAVHREKGHPKMQTHTKKKKEPAAQLERKGMGGQGPQGPGQGHPATNTTKQKKKKRKQHTPTTQEGQQHKPCPNTPTQDPSQDWRG